MEHATGISIKDHSSLLSDPRILRETRHKLVDEVVITLCAVIAGADDWVEMGAFGKEKAEWFKIFLEFPASIDGPNCVPYRWVRRSEGVMSKRKGRPLLREHGRGVTEPLAGKRKSWSQDVKTGNSVHERSRRHLNRSRLLVTGIDEAEKHQGGDQS
jgi:hypothetical protein